MALSLKLFQITLTTQFIKWNNPLTCVCEPVLHGVYSDDQYERKEYLPGGETSENMADGVLLGLFYLVKIALIM